MNKNTKVASPEAIEIIRDLAVQGVFTGKTEQEVKQIIDAVIDGTSK